MTNVNLPIVCDLSAVSAADRERLLATVPALFRAVEAVHALPDGYAFRFAAAPGRLPALAEFVEHERLCCPFYHFALEVEPGGGPMWLKLTGGEGVKDFMEAVFGDMAGAVEQGLIRPAPGDPLEAAVAAAAPALREALGKAGA
jgi:hypothetical protein